MVYLENIFNGMGVLTSMHSVAVLIPCFNESATIQAVINDFRAQLPHAVVYVCDNNSRDDTAALAKAAGAVVWHEPLQGKGNVIRRMFADIDSDLYVIVDGDSTYPASHIGALIACLLENRLDMVVGRRIPKKDAHRAYHSFGNHLFNYFTGRLFGRPLMDMFSGYQVFSRRFVKSFPALSRGFEIEAEMCVHALELKLPFMEIDVPYTSRPTGSFSKLHTVRDGLKILLKILMLFKEIQPFRLFLWVGGMLMLAGLVLGYPLILTWLDTGFVPRFPTAFIVVGLFIFAMIAFTSGIILDGIAHLKRENKRLHYLKLPWLR
jgi:glycosyltransferase involved in cell wall biosynthesis